MSGIDRNLEEQVRALEGRRAFVDRSGFRTVLLGGVDAVRWLNDLTTADVQGIGVMEARRSLLLTPTGRIRADLHVVRTGETDLLLIQDPVQPEAVDEVLSPYVLSSQVELRPARDRIDVFCLPGCDGPPDGLPRSRPSMLGEGVDVVIPVARRDETHAALTRALTQVTEPAVVVWRIRRGIPRFGVDLDADSLPAEAGLEILIDFTKGCFLGQESVAKVRNLGHPPRVTAAFRTTGEVRVGQALETDGREVGRVTSAAAIEHGTALIARLTWDARFADLVTSAGDQLLRAG